MRILITILGFLAIVGLASCSSPEPTPDLIPEPANSEQESVDEVIEPDSVESDDKVPEPIPTLEFDVENDTEAQAQLDTADSDLEDDGEALDDRDYDAELEAFLEEILSAVE